MCEISYGVFKFLNYQITYGVIKYLKNIWLFLPPEIFGKLWQKSVAEYIN